MIEPTDASANTPAPRREPELPTSAPIAVVGAGLAGLAVAAALGEAARQCVILEAGRSGGTCPESLGVLRAGPEMHVARLVSGYGTEIAAAAIDAAVRNRDLLEVIADAAPEIGWNRCGSLRLVGADEADELARSAAFLRGRGRQVHEAPASELWSGAPARFTRAALHADDGVLDAAPLARGLERRARTNGARLFESVRVERLEDNGEVRLHTAAGTVRAEIVIVTTGAALPQLVPFCRFKIVPMRAQALCATPDRGAAPRATGPLALVAAEGLEMWRLHPDGTVSVCGSRHLPVARELGAREGTSPEVQRLLEANLHEFERFGAHRVSRRWSGVQAVACDGLPVVGAVPGRPRVLVCGGFGMNGLGWAFVAAETIAALIEHGRAEHATALSPRRFL